MIRVISCVCMLFSHINNIQWNKLKDDRVHIQQYITHSIDDEEEIIIKKQT